MAKQTLPVNFKDDILAPSMGGKRKYRLIDNGDGTYSLEDVTEYTQTGSDFGAGQINATNQAVNESCDKADVIDDLEDVVANQASGMIAGAKAVAELNGKLPEESDNYIKFEDGTVIQWGNVQSPANSQGYNTVTFPVPFKDTSYRMQATPRYASSSYPTFDVSTQVINESRACVYFRQTGNVGAVITGVNADWMAIGKWK